MLCKKINAEHNIPQKNDYKKLHFLVHVNLISTFVIVYSTFINLIDYIIKKNIKEL